MKRIYFLKATSVFALFAFTTAFASTVNQAQTLVSYVDINNYSSSTITLAPFSSLNIYDNDITIIGSPTIAAHQNERIKMIINPSYSGGDVNSASIQFDILQPGGIYSRTYAYFPITLMNDTKHVGISLTEQGDYSLSGSELSRFAVSAVPVANNNSTKSYAIMNVYDVPPLSMYINEKKHVYKNRHEIKFTAP